MFPEATDIVDCLHVPVPEHSPSYPVLSHKSALQLVHETLQLLKGSFPAVMLLQ
jgi:hypothetical protein